MLAAPSMQYIIYVKYIINLLMCLRALLYALWETLYSENVIQLNLMIIIIIVFICFTSQYFNFQE